MSVTNRQIRLAARPVGVVKPEDWEHCSGPLEEPGPGRFAGRTRVISLGPAMSGWLDDRPSYLPPVEIGEVMRAGSVIEVTASNHPDFQPGDHVVGTFGVQEYVVSDGRGTMKIDTSLAPPSTCLGALGMPGMTAYFGLLDVGALQDGETVVVSGAAGAVGTIAGQIAKAKGCWVVGIAGGPRKRAMLTGELGFDATIDYRTEDVGKALRRHAPNGIDVYFDDVGGDILDAARTRPAMHARVVVCGAISQYNNATPVKGPSNYLSLLVRRARMEGIVVFDYARRYAQAAQDISARIGAGLIKVKEHVVSGSPDDFPEALQMLFRGENVGNLELA
ncbi:NADP-dependent oxidoreductase [Streptomyces sp. NPDC001406]|uniref:NADP-dependent oxidoreductase n=1 Tax=Streptomyces sp. NPDC001406 TaxID=3364572 RepID=UPI003682C685